MQPRALIVGDMLSLALLTLFGFASHAELTLTFLPRMAAAFVPLCIGWFLLAPGLGLFSDGVTRLTSELWRPAFVMVFVGPLAAVLRGLLLSAPVMPVFAVVLTVTGAVCLTLWRLAWLWWMKRRLPGG